MFCFVCWCLVWCCCFAVGFVLHLICFGLPCLPCLACCLVVVDVQLFINSVDIMRLLVVEFTRLLCCVLLSFRC